jgi:hypothetical protein
MARKPESERSSGAVSIGGSVQGSAISTGDENYQTISTNNLSDESPQIAALTCLLEEARSLLCKKGGAETAAVSAIDDALTEARSGKPNKTRIGSALEVVMSTIKTSSELVSAADKLLPLLTPSVGWLGAEWSHLLTALK